MWKDGQPNVTAAFTPQVIGLVLISVRGCVNSRDKVRSGRWSQWKIPVTPSKMEHATFRVCSTVPESTAPRVLMWLW